MNKKEKKPLSAFSIIFIILIIISIITIFLPKLSENITKEMLDENISLATGVRSIKFSNVFMSMYNGFVSAVDVSVFVLFLGGFSGIVAKTKALDAGVATLVKKLKGKELLLIPILMTLFSIGGSTYGMAEDSIAFYALICSTMVVAGLDTMVAVATVMLGAGVGVLGSTVNPFATGIAIAIASESGVKINNALVLILGAILWISSLIVSIIYVMNYARKIKKDKGSIILSLQEKKDMEETFGNISFEKIEFTKKQKLTLIIFAVSFIIMIISLIAWEEYGITFFLGWSEGLTGLPLGRWYFGELAMWFTFTGIIIAIINRFSEKEIVDSFINGAKDILPVVLIIALSRGVSVLMSVSFLDKYILNISIKALSNVSAYIFTPLSYLLYLILSIFIPSTSGLATLSIPILAPLTSSLSFSPEVMIMIFSSACGVINLITPISGVVMGGLATAKVQYSTYISWVFKLILIILAVNIFILTIAMMIL